MTLRYTTSDYPRNLVAVDCMSMRCLARPPRTCDSDVAGSGATLNDDYMLMLMFFLLVKRYNKYMLFDLVKHPSMQLA